MKSKTILIAFAALGLFMATGCKVMLIGAYDQVTDQGIQKIQTDVTGLIVTLKKNLINNNGSANAFANFDKTYSSIESETESLSVRTKALPKYAIVTNQLTTLNAEISQFENLHKSRQFTSTADTTILNLSLSTMEVAFTSMASLQNGLKTTKIN